MVNTRAKRAAESSDPSNAVAGSIATRSLKRSKKTFAEAPKQADEAVPLPKEPAVAKPTPEIHTSTLAIDSTAISSSNSADVSSNIVGTSLANDIVVDDADEEENQDAPELTEEVRASDLYLDTVRTFLSACQCNSSSLLD